VFGKKKDVVVVVIIIKRATFSRRRRAPSNGRRRCDDDDDDDNGTLMSLSLSFYVKSSFFFLQHFSPTILFRVWTQENKNPKQKMDFFLCLENFETSLIN